MPKISVQLEADSAEEFRELLLALAPPAQTTAPRQYETINRIKKDIEAGTFGVASQQEPEASQEPPEAEGPAGIPLEQMRGPKRRGRPAKAAPVEPEQTTVEPTVEQQMVANVTTANATLPEPTPEPVKAEPVKAKPKPKAMPHAQPENGAATRQDLLDAFSEYVQRYGASFGFSDISSLLQKNLGPNVRKASDVLEVDLPMAIAAIKAAIADNPFNRKRDYA